MPSMDRTEWLNRRLKAGLDRGDFKYNEHGRVVCSFCGGNCGQCGNTDVLGWEIPADMQVMVNNLDRIPRAASSKPEVISRAMKILGRFSRRST